MVMCHWILLLLKNVKEFCVILLFWRLRKTKVMWSSSVYWCITCSDSCLYNFVHPLFSLIVLTFGCQRQCGINITAMYLCWFMKNDQNSLIRSAHCSPQVEPYFLWDQCCQLRVQWGTFLLSVCGGSGWLLLTSGWPRTNISGLVSGGQCLQWCLVLYQHLLGLVWQRVWVAGWLLVVGLLLCIVGAFILEVINHCGILFGY